MDCKAHSREPSMAPEDPSNLGLEPTDARRSMDHLSDLAPSVKRTVDTTSANFKNPKLIPKNKLPVVAIVAWQLL